MTGLLWKLRSKALGRWPITFNAGPHTVTMIAEGQIAEAMWRGAFEQVEREFAVKMIKPGMCVLNIGANAGLYTLIASKMVGEGGGVYAFEPCSHTFAMLEANIARNLCTNVTANHLALSNFSGQLSLNRDPLHPEYDGHFFVRRLSESPEDSSRVEIVPCRTLDDYWTEVCGGEIKPVDFIVIDVEGAELGVFQGALNTLVMSSSITIIIECTEHLEELQELLERFKFNIYKHEASSHSLIPAILGRGSFFAVRGFELQL